MEQNTGRVDMVRLPGGHEMRVVDDLEERLHLVALLNLLLAHAARHLAGVAVDASHQRVAVGLFRRTLVVILGTQYLNTFYKGVINTYLTRQAIKTHLTNRNFF